jgi:hypothetical protein
VKEFKLRPDQIQDIARGLGSCFASDKITVDGRPVGFMYREQPDNDLDSGWRFLSGTESDAYLEDASHLGLYDVNTIANYDRSVVPFLGEPIGSVFEKPPGATSFARVTDWAPPP